MQEKKFRVYVANPGGDVAAEWGDVVATTPKLAAKAAARAVALGGDYVKYPLRGRVNPFGVVGVWVYDEAGRLRAGAVVPGIAARKKLYRSPDFYYGVLREMGAPIFGGVALTIDGEECAAPSACRRVSGRPAVTPAEGRSQLGYEAGVASCGE